MIADNRDTVPDTPRCYEHPLHERMRALLRLEFLFFEFRKLETVIECRRSLVPVVCDLLSLLSRADGWSEIIQDLQRETDQLENLRNIPDIDASRLEETLTRINDIRSHLTGAASSEVRIPKLLLSVMQRASVPGGLAPADLPAYTHWLQKAAVDQQADIQRWTQTITPIEHAVHMILSLTRARSHWQSVALDGGQVCLPGNNRKCLVRIKHPAGAAWYPEISGGRQRVNIRLRGENAAEDEALRQLPNIDIAIC